MASETDEIDRQRDLAAEYAMEAFFDGAHEAEIERYEQERTTAGQVAASATAKSTAGPRTSGERDRCMDELDGDLIEATRTQVVWVNGIDYFIDLHRKRLVEVGKPEHYFDFYP